MNELISQLTQKIGISEVQARQAIEMITKFVEDKVPLVKGQLHHFLTDKKGDGAPQVGGINLEGLG